MENTFHLSSFISHPSTFARGSHTASITVPSNAIAAPK